ncbi:MAG: tetratricopeptide repeat protein [Candidatus Auribacter fodinae]|jgi:tetratricopeptide (TPR) repeat protein|uniref:Tetratricopeptide repeat protein n=1 Tax=Candidatus Auribacter fodinae TaxID=2093366 RepID=A0A3A4R3Y4_9BACT|nr:MAG: tetratricopeptide repeat protein [Candidatus Auribacter fodinae]
MKRLYYLIFVYALVSATQGINMYAQEPVAPADNESVVQQPLAEELDNETKALLNQYYTQAFDALRHGEYSYAAMMFEKYLEISETKFKVFEYLTQIYMHTEDYIKAIGVLTRAIHKDPSYLKGYTMLGTAYRESGLYDEAIAAYQRALELKADSDTFLQLGLTYERKNQLDKAEEMYQETLQRNPFHAEAHFSIGLLRYREKDYEDAYKRINLATQLDPKNHLYPIYLEKLKFEAESAGVPILMNEPENN